MRLSALAAAAVGPLEAAAARGDLGPILKHLSPAVAKLTVRGCAFFCCREKPTHWGATAARAFLPPPRPALTLLSKKKKKTKNTSSFQDCIADSASGCRVTTTDGRTLLDCAGGIGVTSTGHAHPAVAAAIGAQAARLSNAQQNLFPASRPLAGLLDRLVRIVPPGLDTFFFSSSGSEAIDQAVKIARAATGRPWVLSFDHGFHGRTLGALSLTNAKAVYRAGFSPLLPSTAAARYPGCLRCPTRRAAPDGDAWYGLAPRLGGAGFPPFADRRCCNEPLDALAWQLKQQVPASEVAAIVVEPILGEGGFLTPPPGFMDGLRGLCDSIGALLVVDEVQSGAGRTGAWWGHSHVMEGSPDIMVFAKGIASGFPFAGVAARPGLHERIAAGSMGGTYGGNPMAAAAASATIDVIEGEGLMANATARGRQLAAGLVRLATEVFPGAIVDVRGRGLMLAVEFGDGSGGLDARPGTATAVAAAAGKRGLMVMTAGAREALRFLPPLIISEAEVEEALAAFEGALGDVFGGGGGGGGAR
jgi:4-aminobutyrate aminotransferase